MRAQVPLPPARGITHPNYPGRRSLPADDAADSQLVASALAAGFAGGLFVDFPHPTPARKFYLCLARPTGSGGGGGSAAAAAAGGAAAPAFAPGAHLSPRCCNLAFPKKGEDALNVLSVLSAERASYLLCH